MARPTELQRKAALIEYYLRKHDLYPTDVKARIPLLGEMTRAGFDKWREGETHKPRMIKDADAALKQHLGIALKPNLLGDQIGIMELGKHLKLTRSECRQAIDILAGEMFPTFSRFNLDPPLARSVLSTYRGLYVIYRIEQTHEAAIRTGRPVSVICMTLSVRYGLRSSKKLAREQQRIRCKLNIPSYRIGTRLHEYDGYVTAADASNVHYWFFEARTDLERDAVFIMSGELEHGPESAADRRFATGTMITRSQEKQSRPTIWPIVIERVADLPKVGDDHDDFENDPESRFTQDHAHLVDPSRVAPWIIEALKAAEGFSRIVNHIP